MFTYDCKCHYLISHGVFYDYLFFLSFWLFLYFIVAWIFFSFEICFVLYCPLFFFPNSPTDLWNNNFLNTQTLPSNLSVPFFFFQISLPPCFILLFQSGLITVAFSGLPFSFSPVLDFQFPGSSVVFSEAHILITWWLNYMVLGCLQTCLYYLFYIYNL